MKQAVTELPLIRLHRYSQRIWLYLSLFVVLLAATMFFLSTTTNAQSGGGVGAGGDGGSSGTGDEAHWTYRGWGWTIYDLNGAGSAGPRDGFRNGSSWNTARSTCQNAGASQVYAHIVLDNFGKGMIYDYKSRQENPSTYRGHFTAGTSVDAGRATAIDTSTARNAFNNLGTYGVSTAGYTFGGNVGWFCYNYSPPQPDPTCTISANPNPMNRGWDTTVSWSSTNSTSMTVTGNGNSWSGTSGSRTDSPTANVTYSGSVTGPGGSATCSRTVTVIQPPTCTISASPSSYVGGGANTTTISWSSNGNAMTVRRGGTTLSTSLNGSYTDNQQTAGTYTYSGEARRPGANGTTMYGYCSVNVTVYAPPSCSVSPAFAIPTQTVTFTATGGNPALPYTWSGGYTGNPYTTSYGVAGTYTVTVTNGGITNSCTAYVVNKPYARVYAGDTLAGVGFGDAAGGCPAGSITDGKRQLGFTYRAGANYAGGGNSHANIGTADIVEFIAGTLEPGPFNPRLLAFENTSGSAYGGDFNTSHLGAACAVDYYGRMPTGGVSNIPSDNRNLSSLGDGNHFHNGNFRLTGNGSVNSGDHVTLYVNGDVFIEGNITYAGAGGYGPDPKKIPSFKLVVRGNIYVGAGVTELNGMYIAQPRDATTGGTFYTCGFIDSVTGNFRGPSVDPGGSGSTGNPYISSEYMGACSTTQLTVYGAVVARDVRLLRSRGTVNTSVEGYPSPGAAERFILTPDTWFNGDPSKSKPFQSYTQLPPIL